MKTKTTKGLILLLTIVFIGAFTLVSVSAQTPTQQTDATQTQVTQAPNLQTELGLTPDQIQKWRAMNREFGPQEIAGRVKLRDARLALAEAMEAPTPNEALIKQRAKDLADAQSAMTQLQALRQARMLQILTPEQRVKLKEIRERTQSVRQGNRQQGVNGLNQRQQLKRANDPLLTPAQRRAIRRQQRPIKQ